MAQENENSDTPIVEPTLDELAFVASYLECNMNGTRAYMKLHPKASYDSARSSAPEILAKPSVKAEIKRRLEARAMSAEEAIARVGAIARAELMPFIRVDDEGFTYFNFADPEAQEYFYLIKKMKTKRERRIEGRGKSAEEWEGEWVEVELHDALAALRDVLKMHGKLTEKVDVTSAGEKITPAEMTPSEIATRVAALLKAKDANGG